MSPAIHTTTEFSAWLRATVSACLKLSSDELEAQIPLTRYGLDSLAAAEITSAIASVLGCEVPESLLLHHPDLQSLERYMAAMWNGLQSDAERTRQPWPVERMLADTILPCDITPAPARAGGPVRSILLTGATGFLGAHLLHALLRETHADLFCLVRAADAIGGLARLRQALSSHELWDPSYERRVHPVIGGLGRPRLGLETEPFDRLCRTIDAVYHSAAAVDWVSPYAGLRDTNVSGTVELLRLACRHRAKPFHFVSTAAACYSTAGPSEITEEDPLPPLGGIHLGYAQSKWVAETLVRRAGERGLPVTIFRPSLISGDSRSGRSNTDDLLARLIKGSIQMGCAPDLDWLVDCCPVDYVADAIVRLSRTTARPAPQVFHLVNPKPRHWREAVLWMNLYGYSVRLLPYASWVEKLAATSHDPTHALRPLRPFFEARPDHADGLTLPELYEEPRRSRLGHMRTAAELAQWAVSCPPLNAHLLDRYFLSFIDRAFLPAVARPSVAPGEEETVRLDRDFFASLLRRFHHDDTLRVLEINDFRRLSEHSIITELTSWRSGRAAGLSRVSVVTVRGAGTPLAALDMIVKVKPRDEEVIEVGERVAALCGEQLGDAFAKFKDRIGLTGCHLREMAVYRQRDDRFRRHAPAVYGMMRDDNRHAWILAIEDLKEVALMDTAEDVSGWQREHIEAAVRGIAEVHAIWYEREAELLAQPWLGPVQSARGMAEMAGLWTALADHAGRDFADWAQAPVRVIQRDLIARVGEWWRPLDVMPRTLIHNDFNPRNIALRRTEQGLRLCAYDWELSTLGVPQHDLAELLCFVLTPAHDRKDVFDYLELHRLALQQATGRALDPASWRLGFQLSLYDLILNRFPMYAMIDTFRRQAFLPRVIATWQALYELFPFTPTSSERRQRRQKGIVATETAHDHKHP